jgi:hypothetical protein
MPKSEIDSESKEADGTSMSEMGDRDKRRDPELRALLERAAELGAERALQKFGDLTPHDLSTREGREALRDDFQHSHTLRSACDTVKREGWRTVGRAFWTIVIAILVGGFIYTFKIDPSRFQIPGG